MQTGYCHMQNYIEMLEPQKGKGHLLIGLLIDTQNYSFELTVCVVYTDGLPAISQA